MVPLYKRLREYLAYVDALLSQDGDETDWESALRNHVVQISFFQHERLIHLLVTLAFALMELVCAVTTMITGQLVAAVLMLAFLVPLVPYVVHYYHLENGTQLLYGQYDRLRDRAQG